MQLPTSTTFSSPDFPLTGGGTLPELVVAYETWGTLSPGADNAILLCHGYTSHPHAGGDAAAWCSNLLGPGKAIDTDRWFVVCANMLGSAYGTSGPASLDPATGQPYGPDFPAYSTADMLAAQHRLLDHLGVGELKAVIGFSYGGHLTFLWGATHPERMRALVPIAGPAVRDTTEAEIAALRGRFEPCAGWNGGHYYDHAREPGGVREMLVRIRAETLNRYGAGKLLEDTIADPAERTRIIQDRAEAWADAFDANSLIKLREAGIGSTADLAAIKAPVLYALSRTDSVVPVALGPETVAALKANGVDATLVEIPTEYGHLGPMIDADMWADKLETFLNDTP